MCCMVDTQSLKMYKEWAGGLYGFDMVLLCIQHYIEPWICI